MICYRDFYLIKNQNIDYDIKEILRRSQKVSHSHIKQVFQLKESFYLIKSRI